MTANKSFVQQSFERAFESAEKIAYNPEWKQGDYFNGACHQQLAAGQIFGAAAEGDDARRMLLIGTRCGTMVVFERYSPNLNQPFVLVSNGSAALRFILESGSIDDAGFNRIVNPYNVADNIGSRLERVFSGKESGIN
jgi:hypothetical protein